MWLSPGALGTKPMNLFYASKSDFIRVKTCLLISVVIKLHHHRVITGCQGRLSDVSHCLLGTVGTASFVDNFDNHRCCPTVSTCWAQPVPACATAGHHLICCHPILGCVPVGCSRWCHCQKQVVVAKTSIDTERTLVIHALPLTDLGQPLMRQSMGTLITCPPDAQITARMNLYVSQVLISDMMPLLLYVGYELADVWPFVLHQALLNLWRATACALTSSCRVNRQRQLEIWMVMKR